MSRPQKASWQPLKEIGRYVFHRPRLVLEFRFQVAPRCISVFSDSDWAGSVRTRRSTRGGSIMLGGHLVKSWCRQQRVTALSSAEAKTYALVCASCEGLGVSAFGKDLGLEYGVETFTDAKAALGIIQRTGIGQVRHIRTQELWLQELGRGKRIHFLKIPGEANPADAFTKYLAEAKLNLHSKTMNARFDDGRSAVALALDGFELLEDLPANLERAESRT